MTPEITDIVDGFAPPADLLTCILFLTRSRGWTTQVANIPEEPPNRNLIELGIDAGSAILSLCLLRWLLLWSQRQDVCQEGLYTRSMRQASDYQLTTFLLYNCYTNIHSDLFGHGAGLKPLHHTHAKILYLAETGLFQKDALVHQNIHQRRQVKYNFNRQNNLVSNKREMKIFWGDSLKWNCVM